MKHPIKTMGVLVVFIRTMIMAALIGLAGCFSTMHNPSSQGGLSASVGPVSSIQRQAATRRPDVARGIRALMLEVAVMTFDPNIPTDPLELEKFGIWPELRRTESTRFALALKSSLQDTGAFGRVHVVPSVQVTADLYISGTILKSNGEDVEIKVVCQDISDRKWCDKKFSHRVHEEFYRDQRNRGQDAYAPVFDAAAQYIVSQLKRRKLSELAALPMVKEMRFGRSLSAETFDGYLVRRDNRIQLTSLPADNDPMLRRIRAMRIQDQLFVDRLQGHYEIFNEKVDESYRAWQQQSLQDVKVYRKLRRKAGLQKFFGSVLIGLSIAAAANSDSPNTAVAATAGALGGVLALQSGFQNSNEAKVHRDAINELGRTIDFNMSPHVIRFENETRRLVGNVEEQYQQWIAVLREIFDLEKTPPIQL